MATETQPRKYEVVESQVAPRPRTKDGVETVYLSSNHWKVLVYLGDTNEKKYRPSLREIAERCGYEVPTGGRAAVLALGRIGLVQANVRQARSVSLTDEGERVYKEWVEAGRKPKAAKKRKSKRCG